MPTYQYECDSCGHSFELFQQITEKPVKNCPRCGGQKARRLIGSGAAVLFKGSGFYATDYRSKSYNQGSKADKAGSNSCESCPARKTGQCD